MLNFKPINLEDQKIIKSYTSDKNYFMCTYCFIDLYMWQFNYATEYCEYENFLFIKMQTPEEKQTLYLAPFGQGDYKKAILTLEADAKERNIPFIITAVPEEIKPLLEELFPDKFNFTEQRDYEDYIYLAENLIELKGKKYHSKRNFVNRFLKEYEGRWKYEDISKDNIREIFDFHLEWGGLRDCSHEEDFLSETCAISRALKSFDELNLKGGLIKLDEKIIAFTLGSKSHDDMFIVHIEKANPDIAGSYQMINQQFAIRHFENITYVNREEDLGIEGLRKAKLSYYPVKMGVSFRAEALK